MRNRSLKALSIIMSLVLVVGLCPGLAYANEGDGSTSLSSNPLVAGTIADFESDEGNLGVQAEFATQANGSVSDFLSVVKSQPNGTGGKKYNGGNGAAWCAYFVVWCARQAGVSSTVIPSQYACQTMVDYFKKQNRWISCSQTPRAGDLVFYSSTYGGRSGHVGVVTSVSGKQISTKEGNTGSGVVGSFSNRKVTSNGYQGAWGNCSYILGFARPNYSNIESLAKPTIVPTDILGGKSVELCHSESATSIRYTLDGKTDPTNSYGTVYDGRFFDAWTTMGVRAIAYKPNGASSIPERVTLRNGITGTPTLKKVDMPNGATIVLDAPGNGETIFYTTDGTDPSFDLKTQQAVGTKYTGSFTLTENTTIKAIAVRSGQVVSGTMTEYVEAAPPSTPSTVVVLNGRMPASKIAVDDAVTVIWDLNQSASSYTATLYDENGEVVESTSVKANQAVFTPSVAGQYSVGIKAVNAVGASEESELVQFEAMAPCQVNFVDKVTNSEGNTTTKILDKQLVRYGYSAENPAVPVKRGYTFAGWDKDTPLTHITENNYEIVATWQINSYTVRFYKDDGKTLITSQSVEYGSSATPPTPPAAATGYVFAGWAVTEAAEADSARDINNVDSNMSLKAVYSWADQELPVVVSISKAERNERVYTVDVDVTNGPTTATTAILRVSLKTSSGKLVQSARETISLPTGGATTSHSVTLKYEDGGYVATKAEVEVVGFSGDNRTGGAYSKAVVADVVNGGEYELAADASEWSTVQPAESSDYVIESEVQYRYQDKQTTTSTNTSLDGWTREGDPVTTYGSWATQPSTTSKPTTSDTLQITGTSTKYNWYHYCSYYDNVWNHDSCWVNNTSVKHTTSTTYDLPYANKSWGDKGGKASSMRGPYSTCAHHTSGHTYWWLDSTVTTYTYQTRSKTVTYGYYKWGDWSEWSNAEAVSSDTRNAEERTVYRTRAKIYNDPASVEDTSGNTYTISGKFDSSLQAAGKEATIMVYNVTNSDPNEDQIQYIGQTTIGADNSYSFSFIPKKEPSAETGDFIVALGVKGSTGLVNVDKIDAPGDEHTVIYLYKNANGEDVVVSEQQVVDGQSAVVPDPPAIEGSRFQRWSASTTNVTGDMTVNALYTSSTYAVAWVDWVNGGVFLETKAYGDSLVAPIEDPTANGYTFKGWDALLDGNATVTGNTVVNAVYDPEMYTVIFANATGGVFAKQEVAYGEAATLPTTNPTAEGMEFVAWDTTSGTPWWNVTEDLIVKPLFAYEGTVSSPYSTTELAEGYVSARGKKVYLESPTAGATIYYTIDGTDPSALGRQNSSGGSPLQTQSSDEEPEPIPNTSMLYNAEEGITVTEPTTIRALAVLDGMNDSSITDLEVNVTAINDIANCEAIIDGAPFFYGKAVEPGVVVWIGEDLLTYGKDYTIEYSNNTALGTGRALVKGIGDYTGQQLVTFDIVEPPEGEGQVVLINVKKPVAASFTYDGKEHQGVADGSGYVLTGTKKASVIGSYSVTAQLKSGYQWADGSTQPLKLTWKIVGSDAARSHRLAGDTALDTMSTIVNEGGFPTGGTVVLSTSAGYWDALTAAGIAGKAGAPVLMTDGKSLSPQTKGLIQKLKPSKIIICGGVLAVTKNVENQAKAAAGGNPGVVRCAGDTATGTACKIFEEGKKLGVWSNTAFVCTNDGYWDALAAAPISYANNMPIFLTEGKGSISKETLDTMKKGDIEYVYIVGGTAAISPNVEAQLKASGIHVFPRLAGTDAIETSQLVAQFGVEKMCMTPNYMGVATTDGYWDALAGAALCGSKGRVLVLANGPQATSVTSFMKKQADKIADFYIFGGVFAVSKATENAAITAAK